MSRTPEHPGAIALFAGLHLIAWVLVIHSFFVPTVRGAYELLAGGLILITPVDRWPNPWRRREG